jgi:cytochrome c556
MKKTIQALLAGSAFFVASVNAQAPASAPPANLNQLMRGTLYPESNIVFAAQDENPADVKRAKDPNMSTDLLTSSYGKWEAVENSALAIAEVANLLSVPGRKCANGVDVPVQNADWAKFVDQMRAAGMAAYAAAQAKNQDKIIDATDLLTKACQNCHFRYRERRGGERCK